MVDKLQPRKTKITFKLISDTHIEIFNDGEEVGQIYSDTGGEGGKPYPHDEELSTLESIQICGFTDASQFWPCGIFHGTKDICLRFMGMRDGGDYKQANHEQYKKYVEKCFYLGKPQLIKTYSDWLGHGGFPLASHIKPTIYDAQKAL